MKLKDKKLSLFYAPNTFVRRGHHRRCLGVRTGPIHVGDVRFAKETDFSSVAVTDSRSHRADLNAADSFAPSFKNLMSGPRQWGMLA
jgi:hypothetical protein